MDKVVKEAFFLSILSCPTVLAHSETFSVQGKLIVVTEYCDGGTLQNLMDTGLGFTEPMVIQVLSHIALALGHCHSLKVAHRDVKPENIIYNAQQRLFKVRITNCRFHLV